MFVKGSNVVPSGGSKSQLSMSSVIVENTRGVSFMNFASSGLFLRGTKAVQTTCTQKANNSAKFRVQIP